MVNRSRNNAKSRRRSRRGGDLPVIQNPPLNPTTSENESWTSGITSNITSGFNKLTDEAKNLVKTEEGEEGEEEGTLTSMTNSVTGFFSSEPKVETQVVETTVETQPVAPVAQVVETQPVAPVETKKLWYEVWKGGRRGSRRRQQGGRGLGLTYYATPVNGLRVAEPTYMEYYKGGKRRAGKRSAGKKQNAKRRTMRFKNRRKCKKTCKKQHRHKRK